MNANIVNIDSLKKLVPHAGNKVKHFCRISARLYGRLALREQFRMEKQVGTHSSFYMVELDEKQLQQEITSLATICADTLARLNLLCRRFGIAPVYPNVDDASLKDVVEVVNDYVSRLVGASDYREWMN